MSENIKNFVSVSAPKILIAGVGGAGINILNTIIKQEIQNVSYLALNTDAQSLTSSLSESKMALGCELTKGYGTGSNPEIGKMAVSENRDSLKNYFKDYSLIFLIGGLGGGTGSGALPVLSQIAKDLNILTVNILTLPFEFEGLKRKKTASEALSLISQSASSYMIIPNENFFVNFEKDLSASDAFTKADVSISNSIKSITDIINTTGQINLDFADIKSILENGGQIMVNSYTSTGEDKIEESVKGVLENLLIDKGNAKTSDQVLLQISGGTDITLQEIKEIMTKVKAVLNTDENFIFGTNFDKIHQGELTLSLIATGLNKGSYKYLPPKREEIQNIITHETFIKENAEEISISETIINEDFVNNIITEETQSYEINKEELSDNEPITFISTEEFTEEFTPVEEQEEAQEEFTSVEEQAEAQAEEQAEEVSIQEVSLVEEIDPFSYDEVMIEEYDDEENVEEVLDVSSINFGDDDRKSFLKSIFSESKTEERKEERKEEKKDEPRVFSNTDFSDLFSSLSPISDSDGKIESFLKIDEE